MKNQIRKLCLMAGAFVAVIFSVSCSKESVQMENEVLLSRNSSNKLSENIVSQSSPSEAERLSLFFMREEEKLARDVYIHLYKKWDAPIFSNISASEQSHMDAILKLLEKYQLPDPAAGNPAGVFTDTSLQVLYDQLVAKGSSSLLNALLVGATIEDMDLRDIKEDLEKINHPDIESVYENLLKGSRNHLRSFYDQILKLGGSYIPQYISPEEFEEVVTSEMETGS